MCVQAWVALPHLTYGTVQCVQQLATTDVELVAYLWGYEYQMEGFEVQLNV